jgi:hypothetical protein
VRWKYGTIEKGKLSLELNIIELSAQNKASSISSFGEQTDSLTRKAADWQFRY